jgi:hypothetical protein
MLPPNQAHYGDYAQMRLALDRKVKNLHCDYFVEIYDKISKEKLCFEHKQPSKKERNAHIYKCNIKSL